MTHETFELPDSGDGFPPPWGRIDWPSSAASARVPFVIVLHGYKAFPDWGFLPELGSRLAQRGIAAIRATFSGSGVPVGADEIRELDAFARNTYTQELDDVERIRTWVTTRFADRLDPARAGLFGFSRSGGIALLHAAERRDYRGLAGWAAISHVLRFEADELEAWRTRGWTTVRGVQPGQEFRLGPELLADAERHRDRLDVLAACRGLQTPTLLVLGARDRAVSLAELERLESALPPGTARRLILDDLGHLFGARHPLEHVPASLEQALDQTVGHFAHHLAVEDA